MTLTKLKTSAEEYFTVITAATVGDVVGLVKYVIKLQNLN